MPQRISSPLNAISGLLNRAATFVVLLGTTFHFFGCGQGDLPKADLAENLRIVAMKSTPVTAHSGDSITVSAMVADPKGLNRTISYEYSLCLATQLDASGGRCSSSLSSGTGTMTPTTSGTINLLSFTAASIQPFAYAVSLKIQAEGETREAVRTIPIVTSSTTTLSAPSAGVLVIDETAGTTSVTLGRGKRVLLRLSQTSTLTSKAYVSWITEKGKLDGFRTSGTEHRNALELPNEVGSFYVYVVLNDGDGGIDFLRRTVQVE